MVHLNLWFVTSNKAPWLKLKLRSWNCIIFYAARQTMEQHRNKLMKFLSCDAWTFTLLNSQCEKFSHTQRNYFFYRAELKTAAMKMNMNGKWKTFHAQKTFHPVSPTALLSSDCQRRRWRCFCSRSDCLSVQIRNGFSYRNGTTESERGRGVKPHNVHEMSFDNDSFVVSSTRVWLWKPLQLVGVVSIKVITLLMNRALNKRLWRWRKFQRNEGVKL